MSGQGNSRRIFLKQVAGASGALAAVVTAGAAAAAPAIETPAGYESLSPEEAAFVEAMVNVMCPADNLTPNGVDCGIAEYIDRQLTRGFGKRFEELASAEGDAFLQDVAAGKTPNTKVPLAQWFNGLVYPLFTQACFADPIYGGNHGKVFWKLIGYPGLPAVHSQNMTAFRGKAFPGALDPKSIQDFS